MKKNASGRSGSSPNESERMNEYWDSDGLEDGVPREGRKAGRRKSRGKGKAGNDGIRPDSYRSEDELGGDTDLD